MICPHCQSRELQKLNQTTNLGYSEFRCGECRRKSNERTGTPFNYLELPTDIVFEIVLCWLRYKLSLRNLAEMFLLRGFEFTHEAVRDWEERWMCCERIQVVWYARGRCVRNGQHCSREDISNPKSSSCVSAIIFGLPSVIGSWKSLWLSVTSAWITLRFGVGSSGTLRNWNGAVAGSFG